MGKKAYDHLAGAWKEPPTKRAIFETIRELWPLVIDVYAQVNDQVASGRISLKSRDGDTIRGGLEWRTASLRWQLSTLLRLLVDLSETTGSEMGDWRKVFAVAALLELDEAVLASLDDDHGSVVSCVLEARWMNDQLELDKRIASAADTLMAERSSAQARERAYRRHEQDPKRAAKLFIHECWKAWQAGYSKYPSKAAFALDMMDKQLELRSPQVIERWCRDWERSL